jgi:hypothetical protein
MSTRGFSLGGQIPPPQRNIDSDAPQPMRQEILDVAFSLAEHRDRNGPIPDQIYRIVSQTLGIAPSGAPYGGFRYAAGRDLSRAEWQRVYDVILRLAAEFDHVGQFDIFQRGVNQALAGNGVVWDLSDDRKLTRVLPSSAQQQLHAAFLELSAPQFAPALQLLESAKDAFDDRPRRDRDACSNVFDALESVAKEKQGMPTATFGQVVAQITALNPEVIDMLKSINTLRNRNFGHGMTNPFTFNPAEVDFTYLACIAGILLFARMP